MSLANMLGAEAKPHSLFNALKQMNPEVWGALPIYRPPYTRKLLGGREVDAGNTAEIALVVAESLPMVENYDVLDALERFVRRMPRTFVEDDVPTDLRSELGTLVRLGILNCVSKKRADTKQYLRMGV